MWGYKLWCVAIIRVYIVMTIMVKHSPRDALQYIIKYFIILHFMFVFSLTNGTYFPNASCNAINLARKCMTHQDCLACVNREVFFHFWILVIFIIKDKFVRE